MAANRHSKPSRSASLQLTADTVRGMTNVSSRGTDLRSDLLSKVPEVTIWFWIIKILCTTVGESFADWINMGLGLGLTLTAVLFTGVLIVVLGIQVSLKRYVPSIYWLSVVVLSVAGTLYTDILTDSLRVPLAVSTSVFAVALAVVFGVWYAREGTLSIHSIVTRPRELFYWLAVLVTFALGTAVGDWTLVLTGWSPGISVLLPAGLIVAIVVGWRLGANAVLSFWLAYILTRPLGANLGDWLASAPSDHGLGLGYGITSVLFLLAILGAVIYLTVSRVDVIDDADEGHAPVVTTSRTRERVMLGYYGVVAVATAALLIWGASQPHAAPAAASEEEGGGSTTQVQPLAPGQAVASFPTSELNTFRTITGDTLALVQAGNQSAALNRIKDLETAWDDDQSRLQPMDPTAWTALDGEIDAVLKSIRAGNPDPATEKQALSTLLASLG
jgi:uncharacterized membrane-anchored protein